MQAVNQLCISFHTQSGKFRSRNYHTIWNVICVVDFNIISKPVSQASIKVVNEYECGIILLLVKTGLSFLESSQILMGPSVHA